MSISYRPRYESELIQRLLRGQGNVCLRSGASSGGMIGDNKSCECLRGQNVFAHKMSSRTNGNLSRFRKHLEPIPRFQRTRAFSFLRVTTRTIPCCVVLCCSFFLSFFRAHLGTQKSSLLLHQTSCRCLLIGWESLGGFLLISIRFHFIEAGQNVYSVYPKYFLTFVSTEGSLCQTYPRGCCIPK